jgi:hypothetical protein
MSGRSWIVLAVAVVVVLGAALFVVKRLTADDGGGADPAAEVVDLDQVAEVAPRLLVTADGWSVTAASELGLAHGEITSTGPEGELTLMWTADDAGPDYPDHDQTLADLTEQAERLPDATIAGQQAAVFRTDASPTPVFQALWQDDGDSIGVAGRFATVDEFLRIAGTLDEVAPSAWLDAVPDTTPPDIDTSEDLDSLQTADDVLDGVPLPAGVDRAALTATSASAEGPYQLGAQVLQPVVCGWYDQWAQAVAAGDTVAAGEAGDALGTSPSWVALQVMSTAGPWPQQVWTLAGDVANNTTPGAPDAYVQASVVPVCG